MFQFRMLKSELEEVFGDEIEMVCLSMCNAIVDCLACLALH